MRTTFTLDDDVAAEVERLRREQGIGLSEAVNRLIRAGLAAPKKQVVYRHRGVDLGLKVDVTDIASVLEILDES
ncbi:MAG: ribbon-helix-helix protein, CopG family [Acidimicrobiia bacterium]|nr:ribbon-helix-helix protein, CopG family [Acidimicrobiia bacterium]